MCNSNNLLNFAPIGEGAAEGCLQACFVAENLCHQVGTRNLRHNGGAIKLTRTMQEREHTLRELVKMEKVRSHLLANNRERMENGETLVKINPLD